MASIRDSILNQLKRLFEPVVGPLTRLFNILKGSFTAIVSVVPKTITLVKGIYAEVTAWRDFRNNVSFKTGVVNLQSVRDHISDLIDEVIAAYHSLVDLFTGGFKRVVGKPFSDAEEAAGELADLLEGFGRIGLRDFLEEIGPRLRTAGGKLFEAIAIIQAAAEELVHVVDDLQSLVNLSRDIRETFQTGEGLFLQQANKRKTVTLEDGTKMKIRVGSLHS